MSAKEVLYSDSLATWFDCLASSFQVQTPYSLTKSLQTLIETVGQMLRVDYVILRPFRANFILPRSLIYRHPQAHPWPLLSVEQTVWPLNSLNYAVFNGGNSEQSQLEFSEIFDKFYIKASLLFSLQLNQECVAGLAFHDSQSPRQWTPFEIQLAGLTVNQIQLLLVQTEAYYQLKSLAQRESLIYAITSAIRSSLDAQTIFKSITHQLGQALQVDGCALSLWDKTSSFVECVGLYDRFQENTLTLPQSKVPIAENPVLQQLMTTGNPVILDDINRHPELICFDLPLQKRAKALLIVALKVEQEIIGSISLRQTENSRNWSASEVELVQAVAAQAAIAVQQSRLYETTKKQAQQLRESEQQVKQLNLYLTESVLKRFLPSSMVNKVALGELSLDLTPETRLITVLFVDLVDFTPLSGQLDPQIVATLLNEYLETMTKAIFQEGGTVDKFIGDAIVALFGAPEELGWQEQAKKAVKVSRKLYLCLAQLNQTWKVRGWVDTLDVPFVQMRCGIHQGTAVVGMFGGGQRSDYTAIGLTVNLAARLQEAAPANQIWVSERVATYLDASEIERVPPLKLKGIDTLLHVFAIKSDGGEKG